LTKFCFDSHRILLFLWLPCAILPDRSKFTTQTFGSGRDKLDRHFRANGTSAPPLRLILPSTQGDGLNGNSDVWLEDSHNLSRTAKRRYASRVRYHPICPKNHRHTATSIQSIHDGASQTREPFLVRRCLKAYLHGAHDNRRAPARSGEDRRSQRPTSLSARKPTASLGTRQPSWQTWCVAAWRTNLVVIREPHRP
jgi:hypothetical protein